MKRINGALIIMIALIAMMLSCRKEHTGKAVYNTINQTLKMNEPYQLNLGSFGDEEGASISKQASNFATSTVSRESGSGSVVYNYIPAVNFTGTDEVEIKSSKGSDGGCSNHKITYTTIKFSVITK